MSQFFGVDLAWGEGSATKPAKESGIVLVDHRGHIHEAGWAIGIDAVAEWLVANAKPGAVIAVDAPLVIPNAEGMRLAEKQVGSGYGRWKVAANASNLRMGWKGGLALRDRLEDASFVYADSLEAVETEAITFFECYPYTTLVGTDHFDYDERPRYKRFDKSLPLGAARAKRALACDDLLLKMGTLTEADPPLDLLSHPESRRLLEEPSPISDVPYKHREDLLDALLCAWTASLWASRPELLQVLGEHDQLRDDEGRKATIIAPARGWQRMADRVTDFPAPRQSPSALRAISDATASLRSTSQLSSAHLVSLRTEIDLLQAELDRLADTSA